MSITVMQVFSALGVEPEPSVSWSVGSRVAAMYRTAFGEQPPKDNRPKTSGGGTHCFAIYPDDWYSKIANTIASVCDDARRQGDMFGPA